jgi:hypothetical protein
MEFDVQVRQIGANSKLLSDWSAKTRISSTASMSSFDKYRLRSGIPLFVYTEQETETGATMVPESSTWSRGE